MLNQLFTYPCVLARHRCAPFLNERERYLTHRADEGLAPATLVYLAGKLLIIAKTLAVEDNTTFTSAEITHAAERYARHYQHRQHGGDARTPKRVFTRIATDWLRFLGRLEEPVQEVPAFAKKITEFSTAMRDQRGLSPKTLHTYEWFLRQFCQWFDTQQRPFATVDVDDVDRFLLARGQHWCRVTIATAAKALRTFFRYAEQQQWCRQGIATAIESPRLFKQASLPVGPPWSVVQDLIRQTETDGTRDIRDRAILILLAVYGLRSSEVVQLRLEQIDWLQQRLTVQRAKQGLSQHYPLIPTLAIALANYLKTVRPRCQRREVFLTLRAPFRPLSAGALHHLTRSRLAQLGYKGAHYGPHALRHACAAHLVSQHLTLTEIGDHLGHRSPYATRIYAKVDLAGLREVARFDLGELQ